jgi:hypothetical protein
MIPLRRIAAHVQITAHSVESQNLALGGKYAHHAPMKGDLTMATVGTTDIASVAGANTRNTAPVGGTVDTTSERLRPRRLLRLRRLVAVLGLLLTLLVGGTPALAQEIPSWIQIPVSNVADVDQGPDGSIWVVKRDGTIHYSANWVVKPDGTIVPEGNNFTQIQASGFSRIAVAKLVGPMGEVFIWAVGSNGTVWKYTKGSFGGTWKRMEQFGFYTAQDVATGPNGSVWVVGILGSVDYSTNGGVSFARVHNGGTGFRRISVGNLNAYVVDSNGGVWVFAGNQWTPQTPNGMEDVGVGNRIFLTSFNGSVWGWTTPLGGSGFKSIAAASKDSCAPHSCAWVVGWNGTLWRLYVTTLR